MNIAIITGASSGIGREFALQMDQSFSNIHEFWLIARREDQLQTTASMLSHKTRIIPMDLTKESAIDQLEDMVKEMKARVCILVNCAGYGLMGPFLSMDRKGALGMVRLNCEALTDLTRVLLPYMKKNSRIIHLASSAAFLPQQDFAVYAATKAYVLSFSRALRKELESLGIAVTAVCPGPVDTPFFDIAEKDGTTLAVKKLTLVQADQVVRKALRDSYLKKSRSVYSLPIRFFDVGAKLLPHDVLLSLVGVMKRLERKV